jgi:Flp pilus assembly protein TadD
MRNIYLALLILCVGCASQRAKEANARGLACYANNDFRCAVAEFGAALRDQPDSRRYRYNLAISLSRIGNLSQAETELQTILQKDPADASARKLLTNVQASQRIEAANMVLGELR